MTARRFVPAFLFIVAGLLIWAAQFLVVYAFNALACARGFAGLTVFGFGVVPIAVTLATAAAALAAVWVLVTALRLRGSASGPTDAFIAYVAAAVASLALIAIVWNWAPAVIVPPCA